MGGGGAAAWPNWPARRHGSNRASRGGSAAPVPALAHLLSAKIVSSVDGLAQDHGGSHILQGGTAGGELSPAVSLFCWHAGVKGYLGRDRRLLWGLQGPRASYSPCMGWI